MEEAIFDHFERAFNEAARGYVPVRESAKETV
jgi:hypothetical protein